MKHSYRLPPARAAALQALYNTLRKNMDAQAALDQAVKPTKHNRMDRRDIALATELTYGYLRLKGRINYILTSFLKNPSQLPEKHYLALGVATYEILFLDKVPTYASVNWAVEFSKTYIRTKLSGLFNAVLRNIGRLVEAGAEADVNYIDYFDDGSPRVRVLSRYYSCPEWLVQMWWDSYGEERTMDYLDAQIHAPATGITIFPDHPESAEIAKHLKSSKNCIAHDGLSMAFPAGSGDLGRVPPESFTRKSFAARQALMALSPKDFEAPVWDACSGRGGKTRVLVEQGVSPLFASDVHLGRLKALRREQPTVNVLRARADRPAPFAEPMKTILLDLPCSGLGVLSRRPDSKWKRKPEDLRRLAELQRHILAHSYDGLADGGKIHVITCTLNEEENEGLVQGFTKENAGAKVETMWTTPVESGLGEFFFAATISKA
ncbi:MAG: transcription antitermination factor NusB [Desulfovibrio sp.]